MSLPRAVEVGRVREASVAFVRCELRPEKSPDRGLDRIEHTVPLDFVAGARLVPAVVMLVEQLARLRGGPPDVKERAYRSRHARLYLTHPG